MLELQTVFDIQGQVEDYHVIIKKLNKNPNFVLMNDDWEVITIINSGLISNFSLEEQKFLFERFIMAYENGFLSGANFIKYKKEDY